ncbi:hypothetical protein AMJ80_10795 [bacterium SM23_31]|nr:MAG: hypothetical protein AMJ80_10795 [bacterium SM23_31]
MTERLLHYLKCVICNACDFDILIEEKDNKEIRMGLLTCKKCNTQYGIKNGIAGFLIEPQEEITNELQGKREGLYKNGKLHDMASEEKILKMPYVHKEGEFGFYEGLAANFDAMLGKMKLFKEASILDVGAGNAWSTNRFAEIGCYAVATDISTVQFAGLESADFFLKKGTYFERIQADMNLLPFKDESFDYIFFNNALHHSSFIDKVLRQAFVILKKGGKLVLVGEPSYGLFSKKEEFGKESRDNRQINENTYRYFRYKKAVRNAGFRKITFFFPPAIDLKLSTGEFGWKRVNKNVFRLLHVIWSRLAGTWIMTVIKKILMLPAALLYNFQVHCIAEKS